MKVFCCECGHPVPVGPDGKIGHCRAHPEAKRFKETWIQKQFAAMREVVESAKGIGRVTNTTANYWRRLEVKAAKVEGWI